MKRSLLILVWLVLFSCAQELIGQTKSIPTKNTPSDHIHKNYESSEAFQRERQETKQLYPSKLARALVSNKEQLQKQKVKQYTLQEISIMNLYQNGNGNNPPWI